MGRIRTVPESAVLRAGGKLLARLGLTAQKPLQRTYQRDPEAIEKWQREIFPAIAGQAKAEGAETFFWDESGFRADTEHGKTWGVRGHTPVVRWSHVKRTGTARPPLQKDETLRDKIEEQLAALQRLPYLVRSFFKAPSVVCGGDCGVR